MGAISVGSMLQEFPPECGCFACQGAARPGFGGKPHLTFEDFRLYLLR
jgi:hypothetical protein